ncbi:MAG: ABC transporter ATP-binding protein [Geminicoccus sp.]|nr:ABC transporter ATP-binding protein [Geminicoccus sp.]
MITFMALLDALGVASIVPFIGVLTNAELVETNPFLLPLYTSSTDFGISSPQQFILAFGLGVFVLYMVSVCFKALTTYAILRFALMQEFSIGKRLIERYLRQPYTWYLRRNSAELSKTILSEVQHVTKQAILPTLTLISQGTVILALLLLLVLIDPALALTVGVVLGAAYVLIYLACRQYLAVIGRDRVEANQKRFTVLDEAFSGIKEIKVMALEDAYIRRFCKPARLYSKHLAAAEIIGQLPRYVLEAIAFGGLLLIMLTVLARSEGVSDALPLVALYAFAGYRLMPAIQKIFQAAVKLRFVGPTLDSIHRDIRGLTATRLDDGPVSKLTQSVELDNVSFQYPDAKRHTLKDISLTIPHRTTVGFVGTTGSGKTTVVDIILGLHAIDSGTLKIDGKSIDAGNARSWQSTIGYVPQDIYLTDASIASNIAFGAEEQDIDQQKVEQAAKIANLYDFVVNELPDQFETQLGERGVRLSVGQRQRVGIARALYNNPDVIILDEATSALDNLTEHAVMEAVKRLQGEKTVIIIAHRLSTIKSCDRIFLLEQGQITGQGTYSELIEKNEVFRAMAADH